MKPITLIVNVLLVILGGVSSAVAGSPYEGRENQAKQEQICGAAVFSETITVDVVSSGCTQIDDFLWVVEQRDSPEADARLIRVRPDPCDASARTVTLEFRRDEVGLDRVDMINLQNLMNGHCPPRW